VKRVLVAVVVLGLLGVVLLVWDGRTREPTSGEEGHARQVSSRWEPVLATSGSATHGDSSDPAPPPSAKGALDAVMLRILDTTGAPVSGVPVLVTRGPDAEETVQTTASGEAEVPRSQGMILAPMPPRPWLHPLPRTIQADETHVVFHLALTRELRGRFLRADGSAAGPGLVWARWTGAGQGGSVWSRADREGRFSMDLPAQAVNAALSWARDVEAMDVAVIFSASVPVAGELELRATLPSDLRGRVVDTRALPVTMAAAPHASWPAGPTPRLFATKKAGPT